MVQDIDNLKSNLLTPDEVATDLKVTAEQVRSLIRHGRLMAINISNGKKRPLYRVSSRDLQEFKQNNRTLPIGRSKTSFKRPYPAPDFFPDLK